MSTFVLILIIVGFALLIFFKKTDNHSEAELQSWMSSKLSEITTHIDSDIEKDKKGEYPHAGKQSFHKRGSITYLLVDKHNSRFDISDKNTLSLNSIMATSGYQVLSKKIDSMNLTLLLEEKEVEGDDVDTFGDLDEYIDDFPRYYTVTISGW